MQICQNVLRAFGEAYQETELYQNYIGLNNKGTLIASALPGSGAIISIYLLGCSAAQTITHLFQSVHSKSLARKDDGIDHIEKSKHYAVLCVAQATNILSLGLLNFSFALYTYANINAN